MIILFTAKIVNSVSFAISSTVFGLFATVLIMYTEFEYLKSVEEVCDVSWAFQCFDEKIGYLDRIITAEFDNGMIMDVCFWGEVGENQGVYSGIRFGDEDNDFVEAGEHTDNCYPIAEGIECVVDGIYCMYYNGDIYEMEIIAS